jgi:hypothetical protein
MQRLRFITLALVAAFAISAVAAGAAAAEKPEWRKGGVTLTGKVKFTAKSGAGVLETTSGTKVECLKDEATGEIEGPNKAVNVVVKYTGCTAGGFPCNKVEEIKTEKTKGTLVYLKAAKKTPVGLLLEPETGTVFAKFECIFTKHTVEGSVICEAKPLNVQQTTGELICKKKAGEKGKQEWTEVEEAAPEHFLTDNGTRAALENTEEITFAEAVELSA